MDPAPAYNITFWSAPQDDQTRAWSETLDYTQPTFGFDSDAVWGSISFGDLPNSGDTPTTPDATSLMTPNPYPDPFSYPGGFEYPNPVLPPFLNSTPALTDIDSVASPASDDYWTGFDPWSIQLQMVVPTISATSGLLDPTATLQAESVKTFEPAQFTGPLVYPNIYEDLTGPIASEYDVGPFVFTGNDVGTSFPSWSGATGLYLPMSVGAAMTSSSDVFTLPPVIGKRAREEDDAPDDGGREANIGQGLHPHKRGKATEMTRGVLEAEGYTKRTRDKSAARTLRLVNGKSKAVGGGAERLASQNARGVYHPLPKGPSVQQGSMSTVAQEKLPWVEGSVEVAAWHHIGMVQEQGVAISANDREPESESEPPPAVAVKSPSFRIPKRLDERSTAMLVTTPADWARGTVGAIKCRLCPASDFTKWDAFTRHANKSETHPHKINFCDRCGDFFARGDSLKRHNKERPSECLEVSPEMAKEKRRVTEKAHKDFAEHEARCLRTGEQLGTPFAQIVKIMYPKSSKRVSMQQSRLQASK